MEEFDPKEFESISPYSDAEAVEALGKVADHPAVPAISQYLFPKEDPTFLRTALKSIHSIDEFQQLIMSKAILWDIQTTAHNFSYDGINYLKEMDGKFLILSNHRDIILDPAITQYVLNQNGLPMTEIAVGDNLLSSKTIEYLLRSNRMIKVIRGISARELYLSSNLLSRYIRQTITSGKHSIWLAQRQGRTKDGIDTTEQGLLKMLDMSGTKSFEENFEELNIVPLTSGWTLPGMAKLTAMPRPVTIKPHRLDCVLTGAEGSGSIIDGEIISASMLSDVRVLEDGSRIVFLTNMGGKTYDGELCVNGGKSAQIADPLTGDITPLEATVDGDVLKMNIRLKPYAAFAYIVS